MEALPLHRRVLRALLSRELRDRADRIADAAPDGYDCFGGHPRGVEMALALTRPLYDAWFRVDSQGSEHLPAHGAAVIAANHSGTLPFDAMMLHADVVRRSSPPRSPRTVMDRFVPALPFYGTLVARGGGINGTRRNVEHVLESGHLLVVFPEGTKGIGKPFRDRYRLQAWRVGHVELAMRYRVPVIPTAIVGPEEQMPALFELHHVHPFGAPYLPIPLTPIPLPVRYHIRYGAPMALHEDYDGDPRDPEILQDAALRVKARVQALIDEGLAARRGVFR
ncbi:MAG: 1-acyl-sn-glycerol-3-phosphate acyltransferase [Sandaracinaceae bacterium]|nr:1-acyl-sn-glycerol-3-phosphate acyltransferase [Sandaracinaceae bacterium]